MLKKMSQILICEKVTKINKLLSIGLSSRIAQELNVSHINGEDIDKGVNEFVIRTHSCGQLSERDVGRRVRLCGWIQFQRMGKFVVLRDSYGLTQLIVENNKKDLQKKISKLMPESVIEVSGLVTERPQKDVNKNLKTGTIEVIVDEVIVRNKCRNDIPFIIRDYQEVNEKTRLEYRYIDLRHKQMQQNLRLRSKVIMKMRNILTENYGFVEVETPTLFKRTPGGAQEYVVPTQFPDCFYSLVQSPQQFKQLLMIGGIDRYFQIARCYRDEGTRPDRQPEFTQLDIELSFTTSDGVISLIEHLIQNCWPNTEQEFSIPFRRLKYEEAMRDYGSDKPDLRSDIKLKEIKKKSNPNDSNTCVFLVIPEGKNRFIEEMKRLAEELTTIQKQLKFDGKLYHNVIEINFISDSIEPINDKITEMVVNECDLRTNDFLWFASGKKNDVYRLMGRIRAECVKIRESNTTNKLSFVWVEDFPLFSYNEETERLESTHHPFTSPKSSDIEKLYSDPNNVLGEHFDLVLNGQEIGGGSVRIHDYQMQEYVLKHILKEDIDSMQYFLDALRSGAPPHGGIALGLDRLISIMCSTDSIRDVMAFPKSAHGKDLMSGSPTQITDQVRKLYHLR